MINQLIATMKSLKACLFVLLYMISLNAFSQTEINFPISGQFTVQDNVESRPYNQVTITENTFTILKNGVVLKQYRIVDETDQGLKIEQFFAENDDPKRDRERFTVKINNYSATEYFVTLYLPQNTESLHLVKNQ